MDLSDTEHMVFLLCHTLTSPSELRRFHSLRRKREYSEAWKPKAVLLGADSQRRRGKVVRQKIRCSMNDDVDGKQEGMLRRRNDRISRILP